MSGRFAPVEERSVRMFAIPNHPFACEERAVSCYRAHKPRGPADVDCPLCGEMWPCVPGYEAFLWVASHAHIARGTRW